MSTTDNSNDSNLVGCVVFILTGIIALFSNLTPVAIVLLTAGAALFVVWMCEDNRKPKKIDLCSHCQRSPARSTSLFCTFECEHESHNLHVGLAQRPILTRENARLQFIDQFNQAMGWEAFDHQKDTIQEAMLLAASTFSGYVASNPRRCDFMARIAAELDRAYAKHGKNQWGRHEFYGIIAEEFEEMFDDIKADAPQDQLETEILQVAAMCCRYYETRDRYREPAKLT